MDRDAFPEVFMIPISSASSGGLLCSQMVWSRNSCGYELKLNDEVVACLRKSSFWSSDYRAESGYGNWRFLRSGMLGNGAEILDESGRVATFKAGWGGPGTITFADGQAFLVTSEGCWRRVWKVTSADGQRVLQVRTKEKTVELEQPSSVPENRLLMVALFIFFRMRQAEEDGAVAVMVAGIS
jgi:hypothetical protein